MRYDFENMTDIDLEDLKSANLQKLFSQVTMLADVAMLDNGGIEISEYEGATWAMRDLADDYKAAVREQSKRAEEHRNVIAAKMKERRA